MIDLHHHPDNWGILPVLFESGDIRIESYPVFVMLSLIIGGLVYFYYSKKARAQSENTIYIALAAIVGGTLGAKLPIWIIYFNQIFTGEMTLEAFLSGRTITGGLIGGTLAVILIKKLLKIKSRKGNFFAPAAAIGISVGRIGCLLRGCCYGIETDLPWGIDFGDKVLRHPTQIYESLYTFLLFIVLVLLNKKNPKPGKLFEIFMIAYFSFRFFIEFIKEEPTSYWGFTAFQIISVLVLSKYIFTYIYKKINGKF